MCFAKAGLLAVQAGPCGGVAEAQSLNPRCCAEPRDKLAASCVGRGVANWAAESCGHTFSRHPNQPAAQVVTSTYLPDEASTSWLLCSRDFF